MDMKLYSQSNRFTPSQKTKEEKHKSTNSIFAVLLGRDKEELEGEVLSYNKSVLTSKGSL